MQGEVPAYSQHVQRNDADSQWKCSMIEKCTQVDRDSTVSALFKYSQGLWKHVDLAVVLPASENYLERAPLVIKCKPFLFITSVPTNR